MDGPCVEGSQLRAFLSSWLEALRHGRKGGPRSSALHLFPCVLGDRRNLYGAMGLPRTHAAWEMQLIADDGLLFFVYDQALSAVRDAVELDSFEAAIEALAASSCELDDAALRARARAHYAARIEDFVFTFRRASRGASALIGDPEWLLRFERVVIEAYVRVAVARPGAVLTFDLFPASTGDDNVSEGLKGLISASGPRHGSWTARRFWSVRAETYTRFYGVNLAKELSAGGLRFALVVPYANGVRSIAMTRCWPIDGAENIARYVALAQARRLELELARRAQGLEATGKPPRLLVSGYSQGGAAVRLFDQALAGQDVRSRAYFRHSAPRGHVRDSRTLAALAAGHYADSWPLVVHSVSVATMGGVDGVGLGERFPQLGALARDQRGASGVLARSNGYGGLHMAICHDHDPARWIVPGPLLHAHRRLRPEHRRKLNLVRILLKFGGPAKALHGGVWMAGTELAFAGNPPAQRLLDACSEAMLSTRFVDEADYHDERCVWSAFPHLVVGTLGYPGWAVVAKFDQSLRAHAEAAARGELDSPGGARVELLREPSWCCDILPREQAYAEVVGAAERFQLRQHERARRLLARLAHGPAANSREQREFIELLRERLGPPSHRRHLLVDGVDGLESLLGRATE